MKVRVRRKETQVPNRFKSVEKTAQEGPLFCIYIKDGSVIRVPLSSIYEVREELED